MNKQYINNVILNLGILMLVFFSLFIPAWQFLEYDVHCDRLEDKCTVKESITKLTVKTFKISETEKIALRELRIPKKYGGTTSIKYVSLQKKDGKYSFARGLLAEEKDSSTISKFNEFIALNGENTLDYTNRNIEFKVLARIFVILALIIALIPISGNDFYEPENEESRWFRILRVVIVVAYILLFVASFYTGGEAQTIKNDEKAKAREEQNKMMYASSCARVDELWHASGKHHIHLYEGNTILYDFEMKNMTGEKLKELYKIDQDYYFKDGVRKILNEGENTLTVRTQYNTLSNYVTPACINEWTFYAKNECLNSGECYVEVKPYSERYPDVKNPVVKYEFIKVPDHTDKYMITVKVRSID
ncbi:MAG: hypothetical protein K6A44_03050 [bacterium]|nr:hypothetical protein [bacterium]